jgi:uncharacterized protein
LIIDCHTHCDWRELGGFIRRGDKADLLGMTERMGTDKICVSSWKAINYDFVEGNNTVLELMRAAPDRILGYCVVHPRYGERALQELDRCIVKGGMIGAKLYPVAPRWRADEASAFPIMEALAKMRVPILMHADPLQPLFNLVEHFPEATIIMAHMGGGGSPTSITAAIHESRRFENVYHDTATSLVESNMVEEAVRVVGAERVLLGTDYPVLDPFSQVAKVRSANVSEKEKEQILGLNIKRLMGRRRV